MKSTYDVQRMKLPDLQGIPMCHDLRKGDIAMCGIVGYTGKEAAAPIILNGLSKLSSFDIFSISHIFS